MKCPACKGSGKVKVAEPPAGCDPAYVTCSKCDGSGYLAFEVGSICPICGEKIKKGEQHGTGGECPTSPWQSGNDDSPEAFVFTNCNVCGVPIKTSEEDKMGMCERCAAE